MFTGIVTEVGAVTEVRQLGGGIRFAVDAPATAEGLEEGGSISVNGVCQTVVSLAGNTFAMEAVEETLSKTTLGSLKRGSRVNLELPLKVGDTLGGHFVQGHVDGVGTVRSLTRLSASVLVEVEIPGPLIRYVVPVGSIAFDGISLTVASLKQNLVVVSIIPHTVKHTTLSDVTEGRLVNVECDLLGKYIEKLLFERNSVHPGTISKEMLRQWGYEP